MKIEECYADMNADYQDVINRLGKPERVEKYLLRFPEEPSYQELCGAFESGDAETAFRAAHSLKGVCMNLGLSGLLNAASDLTEALRKKLFTEETAGLLERVKEDYRKTVECVERYRRTLS